jgi:cation/acetate symporter
MVAATWVQIVKAVMLMIIVAVIGVMALVRAGGIGPLYDAAAAAHPLGRGMFMPGGAKFDLFSAVSLAFGMTVGILGLPHLLIRFFTVPDEKAARTSALVATIIAGGVFAVLFVVVGPAVVAFVRPDPRFHDAAGVLAGGSNMASIHLSDALGGQTLMGITAAVAFATILAVVSGLVVSMASAASHDIYGVLTKGPVSEKREVAVFRLAAGAMAVLAIALALAFQHYNVAFLTTLAFGVAASANFPVLILVLYWRGLTVRGALAGGFFGLIVSVVLTVLGPAVWVKLLHQPKPLFPSDYPALLVSPLTFLVCWAVSKMQRQVGSTDMAAEAAGAASA